jgi:hypothetical protein
MIIPESLLTHITVDHMDAIDNGGMARVWTRTLHQQNFLYNFTHDVPTHLLSWFIYKTTIYYRVHIPRDVKWYAVTRVSKNENMSYYKNIRIFDITDESWEVFNIHKWNLQPYGKEMLMKHLDKRC